MTTQPAIFTAPADHIEAQAMMGRDFTFPDGETRRAWGAGSSGVPGFPGFQFSVSFADGSIWTSENGFETKAARARRLWDAALDALPQVDRDLIAAAFPHLPDAWNEKTKQPIDLVLAAKAWLVKKGKIEAVVCGRCMGTGRYSFNLTDGDLCYGCKGTGKKPPSSRDALRAFRCA